MNVTEKLAILADAAKYDASCASSGADKRHSLGTGGIGSTEGMGICHSYTPDGRCVSLLKILLTNFCVFDCAYCVNRVTSNVRRARFTPDEVVRLTLDFYKRNYIEGLFLSSGIIRNSDYTMEQLVEVARSLRQDHKFAGYIHLKTIPDAAPELLAAAGRYADRLSINVELPTEGGLAQLAPEKKPGGIRAAMGELRWRIEENKEQRREEKKLRAKPPRFAPAGQSTQMIVGADGADDRAILQTSTNLYGNYRLRRVYYSAFSPIPDASSKLPLQPPPLQREHRLYQADWLLRFYDFSVDEIAPTDAASGMLDLDIDPKLAWALRHPERFPVDVNTAPRELLLRVPGLGTRNVERIIASRRFRRLRVEDLTRLRLPMKKLLPFVQVLDHHPRAALDDTAKLRGMLAPKPRQMGLF
ncbi:MULTISPECIES: putative DNA modification/repair radical SAM protein [Pseudoxanthomonas]|uniref:DNA modification/repair radical SAM protein n=1 Tax=Pseudoxanthomonas winnipegensis TaxID=2480810 RepID=A0A4Q8LRZ2_9GAMM|nr:MULTISPECIES: putative DNA modification/repair radical SAM protein [Pseudoxanthomonas]MDQ1120437.1 putative DNA modification/repair radical SAM protein [Pseudoxanthomonas winnipegensis]MDQ1133656.1 putative DNA modification/repair radical SAM protein [Pseudoxanthomonas winnipegensis]MDR6140104.1 putative DNA modification/repair radical SAM protein [Pseudoxanthomonas sp. SORGH_AS_0997]RZZ88107.1 putative DNA modification/repair radical SAM protein [Pseudoxanthomonas winnipegensis]TAA09886.1 